MSIKEVAERATIEFPGALTLEQSVELLAYLAEHLSANINYHKGQHGSLRNQEGEISRETGTSSLTATIMSVEGSDTAQFEHSLEDTSKLAKIRFVTIPGYDELSEYRPDQVPLWDRTKELVAKYFSKE